MTKYATGEIQLTERIERAPHGVPFVVPVYGKEQAHQIMRDAHGVAKRKNCKVTTSIMRAVDIANYEYHMTLFRITVVDRWVVGEAMPEVKGGVRLSPPLSEGEE